MTPELLKCFNKWVDWIRFEKRLSKNTVESYRRDLNFFFKFLSSFYNKDIFLKDIPELNEEDLTSWFFSRLKGGLSHRSNARALSSVKSFYIFLKKKNTLRILNFLEQKAQNLRIHYLDPYLLIK